MGSLYLLTSPSGKRYVGITSKVTDERWLQHVKNSRRSGLKSPLISAIKKYGKNSFTVQTILTAPWDMLNTLEPFAIQQFNTRYPHGYNLREGGSQSRPHEESIQKQAAKMRGRKFTPEQKEAHLKAMRSPEVRAKISEAGKGRIVSKETRKKMSDAHKGRKQRPEVVQHRAEVMRGKKRSAESRKRMSDAHKGYKLSKEHREAISIAGKLAWKKRRKDT